MRFENFTNIGSDRLKEIIRFCQPSAVTGFDIAFKNSGKGRGFSGWCYWQGCTYHDASMHRKGKRGGRRPYVIIKIPQQGSIAYPHITDFGKGYLWSAQFTHEEDIVHLVAHELRHLWQARVKRGHRVWGARGQFSERDADAYAIHKVREWRRRYLHVGSELGGCSTLSANK